MREIKFRGRFMFLNEEEDYDKWLYGNLVVEKHGEMYIYPIEHTEMCHGDLLIDSDRDGGPNTGAYMPVVVPQTVGQFTGLKDKNGREVYEGDVVATEVNGCRYVQEVVWSDITNGFSFRGHGCGPMFHKPSCMEVIGNIHDNPELLEQ